MNKTFDIFLKADIIQKSDDGKKSYFVQGVGSTISKDRQGERLSEKALAQLEEIATTKRIPVFSQHNHSWENTMGYISNSVVKDGEWLVDIALEAPDFNEKTALLIHKKEHGTPIGLSIGGRVLKDYIDKADNSMMRVIDDLELLELSIVGIPANPQGSVISYIAKSLEGEKEMTEEEIKPQEEVPIVKAEVVVEEPKPVVDKAVASEEKQEASFSKSDLEVFRKEMYEHIASEISKLTAEKKAVVAEVEKEQMLENKENSLEKMLEERLK